MGSAERVLAQERNYAEAAERMFSKHAVPPFSWGSAFFSPGVDSREALNAAVNDWMKAPERYLDYRNFTEAKIIHNAAAGYVEVVSTLAPQDRGRLYYRRQPQGRSGYDKAVLVVPHWNAGVQKYVHSVRVAQRFFLPLSTLVYFPVYGETVADGSHGAVYQVVGPSIGQTMFRVWQDVLNLQAAAQYLKSELGFRSVGLFSYSIGSLRAFLAPLFVPGLIDWSVLHFVADSFADAVTTGLSTRHISGAILSHVSVGELRNLWRPISPGWYERYMGGLPASTRLVQGKYDLAFGPENVARLTDKVRRSAPHVKVEEGDYGHFTVREPQHSMPLFARDFSFIYRVAGLRYLG